MCFEMNNFYLCQFNISVRRMNERSKGQQGAPLGGEKSLQGELLLLTAYIRRCPQTIQRQLFPYCYELRKEYPNDHRVKDLADSLLGDPDSRPEASPNSENLIRNLFRILQLKHLPSFFGKVIDSIERDRLKPQQKSKQQIFNKSGSFDRLDMLHPQYDTYYKMSKQERQHHLPQHHPKNKFREFFTEPRFLVRVEELSHFRANEKLKGDILFLHYQGNIIAGGKSYAVARDRAIEVWEMESNAYPNPTLNIAVDSSEESEEKKAEVEEKKEEKKEIPPGTKFSLNGVYNGHIEKITSLSLSLDELYLISGSADRTIKLWCLRLKTCLATYRGHRKTIWDVHFSPSGYYLLSGSADGCMILWKTDEPHAQRVYYHQKDVLKVSFAKDPGFVISAGDDCTIKIWKTLEAEVVRQLRLGRPVVNFNLGFSGSLIVAIESDGRITIFDLLKGQTVNSFYFYEDRKANQDEKSSTIHKMRIHDVCLSEDQRQLSCVTSKYVVIYSMQRLQMKVNNNIFTFFQSGAQSGKVTRLPPKEIIYMGIETNLTHCSYQHKNVLVVAGSART